MRIVFVTSLYPPRFGGGAGKAVALLAASFARRGHHVAVVTLHPGPDVIVEQQQGTTVYSLPLANLYWPFGRERKVNFLCKALWHLIDLWNPLAARRVGRILDEEKPDVVHTHILAGFSVAVWREVKRRGIRLVHTMHDYALLCERSALYRDGAQCEKRCLQCRALTSVRRHSSRMLDTAIAVSQYVQRCHLDEGYYPHVPCVVVHNVCHTPADSRTSRTVRADRLVFGWIGRMEPEKGIEQLLRATQRLGHPGWKLRLAGNANTFYARRLRSIYRDPRIEWLGMQAPSLFYDSVDVVVIPSQFPDPFPYVAIEALQYSKAVIAAHTGGIAEILRLGKTVAFFQPKDEAKLASLLNEAQRRPQAWREGGFRNPADASLFSEERIVRAHQLHYRGGKFANPPAFTQDEDERVRSWHPPSCSSITPRS